jgi:hypothetical protein
MNNQMDPPRFKSLVDVADYLLRMPDDDVKEHFKAAIRKQLAVLKRRQALELVSGRQRV